MLREHPTLAAFIASAFVLAVTGVLTAWHWPYLYAVEFFAGLFVFSRLFAGLPMKFDTVEVPDAAEQPASGELRPRDMAGLDAEPRELSLAYENWKEHQDGALTDATEFEHLAERERPEH